MRLSPPTGPGCLLLVCGLALAACDGGGDPVQQALREASSANQAAAIVDGGHVAAAPAGSGKAQPDRDLVTGMIEQHRAGVAAADAALAQSSDPDVRRMAQAIKNRQTREIAEMQAWTVATP